MNALDDPVRAADGDVILFRLGGIDPVDTEPR